MKGNNNTKIFGEAVKIRENRGYI